MIYTTIVIAALLLLLVFDVVSSDTGFGAALILLLFGGIISPEEALSGFSNKGMVTVGLLFIVSQGVENTGIFQNIAGRFLNDTRDGDGRKRSLSRLMVTMMAPVTVLSSFLNNTPIVTIFTPVVKRWTAAQGLPAGKFLIPLSYAAIFGGACTLIGTSTNLVVHGMILQHGGQGFTFFELAKVGVPVAVAGYLYLALLGPRLLPDTRDPFTQMGEAPKEYFIEMTVPTDSSLIGKTIEQAGLRSMHGVYLTDIERGDLHLGPVTPDRRIAAGDRLFFAGRTDSIADVVAMNGLQTVDEETFYRDTRDMRRHLVEVVVSENSPAVGHTIRDYSFRSVYNAAVVAVSRGGERVNTRLGDVRIRPGDTMVLLTKSNFVKRYRFSRDFYLVSGLSEITPKAKRRGPFALVTVVGMILLAALGGQLPEIGGHRIDMFYAAAAAALILVGGRTIGAGGAREAIRWDVLITIGAAFGVSRAMVNSGVAPLVGQRLVDLMAPFGVLGAIAAIYVVTSVFTAIITNNAAAAIMFPIALSTAESLGGAGLPFFVAVAMGASASFATPIGYQTNLIVQGAGGYRFRDFVKVGLPMNAVAAVVGIVAIALWYVL